VVITALFHILLFILFDHILDLSDLHLEHCSVQTTEAAGFSWVHFRSIMFVVFCRTDCYLVFSTVNLLKNWHIVYPVGCVFLTGDLLFVNQ